MDPLRSYLGRLLLEEITPVVMVLTTPLAEATCRKSGLSFIDMLSPFSLFKKNRRASADGERGAVQAADV